MPHILIVDDEMDTCNVVARILQQHGYETTSRGPVRLRLGRGPCKGRGARRVPQLALRLVRHHVAEGRVVFETESTHANWSRRSRPSQTGSPCGERLP